MRQKSSPYGSVFVRRFVQQRWLVLMTVPALATIIIFHYFPLYGIIVAFKNYKQRLAFWAAIGSACAILSNSSKMRSPGASFATRCF